MTRIAVVDSDSGFVRVLSKRLDAAGWEHRVLSAAPPVEDLMAMRLSAVVVDPAMLGQRAWDFLEQVCAALPGLGIVVCTGRSTVAQRVRGLRLGVDDWVTKPCHPEEVVARVEAVVRRRKRATARSDAGPLVAAELEIRPDQYQAFVGTCGADLTRREFELLHLLAEGGGQVLEREQIYQRVWGYEMARGDRSVDVFVRKVRSKLKRLSPNWDYIHTHFGIGYRFQPQRSDGFRDREDAGEEVADERSEDLGSDGAPAESRHDDVPRDPEPGGPPVVSSLGDFEPALESRA